MLNIIWFKEILFKYVLTNPFVWVLAIANFFVYIVRLAVNDWSALFLVEQKGYSQLGAGGCVSWFEVGGFVGSLLAGWLSDRVFRGRRGPVNVLFSLGILGSVVLFRLIPPGHMTLDCLAMMAIGFWIFGPQMLIGVAAAELAHKKAAATSSGFTGLFGYIGAAAAGYPLGVVADQYGWDGFFVVLVVCSLITCLLLIPLWPVTAYRVPSRLGKEEDDSLQLTPQDEPTPATS